MFVEDEHITDSYIGPYVFVEDEHMGDRYIGLWMNIWQIDI